MVAQNTTNLADALAMASDEFQNGGVDQAIGGQQPRPTISIADIIAAGNAPKRVPRPGRTLTLRPQNIVAQRPNTTPLVNEGQYNNMPVQQAPEKVNLMDIVNGTQQTAPVANNDIMGMDRSKFQMMTGLLASAIAPRSVGGRVGATFGKLGAADMVVKRADEIAAQTATANAPFDALELRKLTAETKKAETPTGEARLRTELVGKINPATKKPYTEFEIASKIKSIGKDKPKAVKTSGYNKVDGKWQKGYWDQNDKFKTLRPAAQKEIDDLSGKKAASGTTKAITSDDGTVRFYNNKGNMVGSTKAGVGKTKVSAKAKSPENIRKEVNKVMVDTDKMYEIQKLYPEISEMDAAGKRAVVKAFITGDEADLPAPKENEFDTLFNKIQP